MNLDEYSDAWFDLAECQYLDRHGKVGRVVKIDYFGDRGYMAEVKFGTSSQWYKWDNGDITPDYNPYGYGTGIIPPGGWVL